MCSRAALRPGSFQCVGGSVVPSPLKARTPYITCPLTLGELLQMEDASQPSQAAFANLLLQELHLVPGTSTWCVLGVGQGCCTPGSGSPLMHTPCTGA